ncbi:MAG: hypothetical protein V4689_23760 [Verrucomicrobiota bacterium]
MSEKEFQPEERDPTEAELRVMLEARELEKELLRKRTSRKFSIILVVFILTLAGVIFCIPGKLGIAESPPLAKPVAAVPLPTPLNPDPTNSDPALVKDLKPFMLQPGQEGDQKENIRFAVELLNFMDAANLKTIIPPKAEEPVKKP